MTPHQFAMAVGAEPKWVQNAARLLGRTFRRTRDEARWLRLVRLLHRDFAIPLAAAAELATRTLASSGSASPMQMAATADHSVSLTIDRPRFESSFAAAFAAALELRGPKQRGRGQWTLPRRRPTLQAARAYGVDLSLLRASLALTPDERLRQLDENAAFLRALRPLPRRS